eukprot:1913123-Heterocapsa_arctica.AAC.1
MSLSLMSDGRQERKMLIPERGVNFLLIDDVRVAADRSHRVNLMHVQLNARIRNIGGSNKDSQLKPALVVVDNDPKHVVHVDRHRGNPITAFEAGGRLGDVTNPGPTSVVRDTFEPLLARVVPLTAGVAKHLRDTLRELPPVLTATTAHRPIEPLSNFVRHAVLHCLRYSTP